MFGSFHKSKENGMSTMSFILSTSLLIFFVSAVLSGWTKLEQASHIVNSSAVSNQIDEIIKASLTTKLGNPGFISLPNPQLLITSADLENLLPEGVTAEVSTRPASGLSHNFKAAMDLDSSTKRGLERCRTQQLISNRFQASQSVIRFCVAFKSSTGVVDSVFSRGSFAEITIQLRNENSAPISWNNFANDKLGVAKVFYTHHYPISVNNKVIYRSYNGYQISSRINGV
jgi:hypothetical protein